jgi:uncharacterized protein YecT (DUF1311 family)
MRCLAILVFVACSSSPSLAQNSEQYRACSERAMSQVAMNECANQEAKRADAELNSIYAELLSKAASEPEAVAKIETAERAWIAYRDAYIVAMYPAKDKQAKYGSIYPMEVDLLYAELERKQTAALNELLQQYSN